MKADLYLCERTFAFRVTIVETDIFSTYNPSQCLFSFLDIYFICLWKNEDDFVALRSSAWHLFNHTLFPSYQRRVEHESILRGVDIYLILLKMQRARERGRVCVDLWLPNRRLKVDDPFIGSTLAYSLYRRDSNDWNIYESRARCESHGRERLYEDFTSRGLFRVGPIFQGLTLSLSLSFFLCAYAGAFFHFPPCPIGIVPFASPSGAATLSAFATRSPISQSALFHAPFTESRVYRPHLLLSLLPPRASKPLPSLEYIRRNVRPYLASFVHLFALRRHLFYRRFALFRIQRARVICFPTNFFREDRKYGRGRYTRHHHPEKSRVFFADWFSNL